MYNQIDPWVNISVIFKTFSEVFVCVFWKSSAMIFFSVMGSSLMYWGGITQLSKSVRWDGCTHLKHSESQLQSCKKLISSVHAPKGKVLRCYGRNGWKKSWPKPAENLCYSSSTTMWALYILLMELHQTKMRNHITEDFSSKKVPYTMQLHTTQVNCTQAMSPLYHRKLIYLSHRDFILNTKDNL